MRGHFLGWLALVIHRRRFIAHLRAYKLLLLALAHRRSHALLKVIRLQVFDAVKEHELVLDQLTGILILVLQEQVERSGQVLVLRLLKQVLRPHQCEAVVAPLVPVLVLPRERLRCQLQRALPRNSK